MHQKRRHPYTAGNPEIDRKIEELLSEWGVTADLNRFREMMVTVLKFANDKPHPADVYQFNIALKEMRYANRVFQNYGDIKTVSIFGSVRTPESSPAYQAAYKFAEMMRESGYMIITGGGNGIMGAAQAGAGRERSFALNISLPFEQEPNETIEGDPKLITFKYFFTRKLNFVKHSHAIALFPGGFGTMDECFETLTLIQNGKATPTPIVMVDEPNGHYWKSWERYMREYLLGNGLIAASDFHLFKITDNLEEARNEILKFYHNFHSYRYIGDLCVIRVHRAFEDDVLKKLSEEFADILTDKNGFEIRTALPAEINEPEIAHLPRLCGYFNKHNFGRLRQLIDRINEF
ncbi:MAG: LOG family protein [bacterium]